MMDLFFDCTTGAAGDMLMAALLELHPDKKDFITRLENIGIPNVEVRAFTCTRCGISGSGVRVKINGEDEDDSFLKNHNHEYSHEHNHEHSHEHNHEHHHTGIKEISHIINNLSVSDKIKKDISAVYDILAKAESLSHGKPIENIHFHEVGTLDAIADITGVCMLIDELKPDKIYCTPIQLGSGTVRCAHGILPVPAPATTYILRGIPTRISDIKGELCTPTGAALLKYFTNEFTSDIEFTCTDIGYGFGTRSFTDKDGNEVLSAVRAMACSSQGGTDSVAVLCCGIDDMTGEDIAFASDILLENGALDVYTTPINMKKNRPGILLTVLCRPSDKEHLLKIIFKHTSTIGIRETLSKRYILNRHISTVHTEYGDIRIKHSSGYGTVKSKPEHDDVEKAARKYSLSAADIIKELNKKRETDTQD